MHGVVVWVVRSSDHAPGAVVCRSCTRSLRAVVCEVESSDKVFWVPRAKVLHAFGNLLLCARSLFVYSVTYSVEQALVA